MFTTAAINGGALHAARLSVAGVEVQLVEVLVVRDSSARLLKALLTAGGAPFSASAPAAAPRYAEPRAPLPHLRTSAPVRFAGALGVVGVALGENRVATGNTIVGAQLAAAPVAVGGLEDVISADYGSVLDGALVVVPAAMVGHGRAPPAAGEPGAAAAPPVLGIAQQMLAESLAAAPLAPAGGAAVPTATLRTASWREVVQASAAQPARDPAAAPVPPLPCTLFAQGFGAPGLRELLLANAAEVPSAFTHAPAAPGRFENPSCDIDGAFVAGKRLPSVHVDADAGAAAGDTSGDAPTEEDTSGAAAGDTSSVAPTEKDTSGDTSGDDALPPPPAARGALLAEAFRKQVSAAIGAAAAARAAPDEEAPSTQLLRANGARPIDLALAAAADALCPPSISAAALAAVEFVSGAARAAGYSGEALTVTLPSNGHIPLCDASFTADPSVTKRAKHPLYALPAPHSSSSEPLSVCVFGWSASDVARAVREVAAALAFRSRTGSTGAARWALWPSAAPSDTRTLPGGACVPLSILVHLLRSFPYNQLDYSFWIKTYNQKLRGAMSTLPDLRRVDAASVGRHLVRSLAASNSCIPLVHRLFGSEPSAATFCLSMGVAVDAFRTPSGVLQFGSLHFRVDPHSRLLCTGNNVEPVAEGAGSGYHVAHYPAFGAPPLFGPCTAARALSFVSAGGPCALVSAESYWRVLRYSAGAPTYKRAGDIAGATAVALDGSAAINLRTLWDATNAAAALSSTTLLQLAEIGPLPRLDAVWAVNGALQDAVSSAVQSSASLFCDAAVALPLSPTVNNMAGGVTSLFALHAAALRAVSSVNALPIDSLGSAATLQLTSALVRFLPSGRWAGHGAFSPHGCLALNAHQVNCLPPPPPTVAAHLGLSDMAPPCRLFLNDCAGGDGVLGAASKQANELGAALAASSKPFVCAHAGCGRFFSTVATLHEHLSATGHHSAPTGSNGTFTQLPVDNKVLVLASVKDLSPDQKTVVAAALATGRSVVLGGAGGTGKTVITRALVEIYNTLWPDCVLWLCPTGIARLVAGSLACTVNSAMGIGRPADDVTWGELVEKGQTPKVQALLCGKRLLVVDESHRAGEREMTALDALLRWANDSDLPFAGIQTCNTGDSCQTLNFTDKKLAAHVKAQLPGVTSGARSWLMSPLGLSLRPLYFELSQILRARDPLFIRAQNLLREGQRWVKGQTAFDFFAENCSPKLPHNKGLVIFRNSVYVPTLHAINSGYVTLYATHSDAKIAEAELLSQAREAAGASFRLLSLKAIDALRSVSRLPYNRVAAKFVEGGGAPHELNVYLGAVVAVTNPTPAVAVNGTTWLIPSSVTGRVVEFTGSTTDDAKVTVNFPATAWSPETVHTFSAAWVDSSNVPTDGTPVATRYALQLRPGGTMTMSLAQGVTLLRGIAILKDVWGDWADGLLYTTLSRFTVARDLVVIDHPNVVNRCNEKELAFFRKRAAETACELRGSGAPSVVRSLVAFLASAPTTVRSTEGLAQVEAVPLAALDTVLVE